MAPGFDQSPPGPGCGRLSAATAVTDARQSTLCTFFFAGTLPNILLKVFFIHWVCSSGLASRNSFACACSTLQCVVSANLARTAGAMMSPHVAQCLLKATHKF